MPTHTCGPCAKARWSRGRSPRRSNSVGVVVDGGVTICGRDREADEVSACDPSTAELDILGGVAVDHRRRRLEAQRFLDRGVKQRGLGTDGVQRLAVPQEHEASALAIIPSVVSMPPNSSTAALEAICRAVSDRDRGGGAESEVLTIDAVPAGARNCGEGRPRRPRRSPVPR